MEAEGQGNSALNDVSLFLVQNKATQYNDKNERETGQAKLGEATEEHERNKNSYRINKGTINVTSDNTRNFYENASLKSSKRNDIDAGLENSKSKKEHDIINDKSVEHIDSELQNSIIKSPNHNHDLVATPETSKGVPDNLIQPKKEQSNTLSSEKKTQTAYGSNELSDMIDKTKTGCVDNHNAVNSEVSSIQSKESTNNDCKEPSMQQNIAKLDLDLDHDQNQLKETSETVNSKFFKGNSSLESVESKLIPKNNFYLDLPTNLDSDDFSRLFKLDKDDNVLFSSEDVLEHGIDSHQILSISDVAAVPESRMNNETLSKDLVSSPENILLQKSLKEMLDKNNACSASGKSSLSSSTFDAVQNLVTVTEIASTQNPTGTTYEFPNGEEFLQSQKNLPASIIQDKKDILQFQRDSFLKPSISQPYMPSKIASTNIKSNDQDLSNKKNIKENEDSSVYKSILPSGQFITSTQGVTDSVDEQAKISAYACLDFQKFTFYIQTLQVIIGRRSQNDFSHKVDVNLGSSKSISRKHAKIFYNFGTERFELSIMGKNGAFVDDNFVERGITTPLNNKSKIQIGQIPFQFVLPEQDIKDFTFKQAKIKEHKSTPKVENNIKDITSINNSEIIPSENGNRDNDTLLKKTKKLAKTAKTPKKVYTMEEIPPEYRTKPTCSYSNLITTCFQKYSSSNGMSLSEIYAGIRALFPYYKYCSDGWQSSVRHNLSLNKSFRKVSKEGKGWLWGLDEEYIAEREKQRKKQAEVQAAKARAAEVKQQQLQAKKKVLGGRVNSLNDMKHSNISQTLATNRSVRKSVQDDNQRTMGYLQQQLMLLTKNRRGLDKQVMAKILTQALAMTINQVTQAAKSKGINGNPLITLIDRNPEHLNLILAAAINAATVKFTDGKVKKLVSVPSPVPISCVDSLPSTTTNEDSQKVSSSQSKSITQKPPNFSVVNSTPNSVEAFDPTSLSKFFQPKQPARLPLGTSAIVQSVQRTSTIPLKRSASEAESSDNDSDNSSDTEDDNETSNSSSSEHNGDSDDDNKENSTVG